MYLISGRETVRDNSAQKRNLIPAQFRSLRYPHVFCSLVARSALIASILLVPADDHSRLRAVLTIQGQQGPQFTNEYFESRTHGAPDREVCQSIERRIYSRTIDLLANSQITGQFPQHSQTIMAQYLAFLSFHLGPAL